MQRGIPLLGFARKFHSTVSQLAKINPSEHYTVVADNGVVVSWHPKKEFPYEHSRPIAEEKKEKKLESAALSDELLEEHRLRNLPGGPANKDLKEIFYTDKNEWLPRPREKKLYSRTLPEPKYREGL
uniref:Large ribosomal subunit protein mL42 n=1 Tax=Plectus sambesii TaxID=2011161 RepID=A0A914V693_9BILA